MTQKDFERLSELMAQKGVIHEAFELLADLRQSERLAKEEVLSIKNSVMDALKGFVDFEGFTPSEINYLQVIRKMKSQLTWRPVSDPPKEDGEYFVNDCGFCEAMKYEKGKWYGWDKVFGEWLIETLCGDEKWLPIPPAPEEKNEKNLCLT